MRGIRTHLTFANVASAIALFAVLGGGVAFALPGKNKVNSGDIRNGAIKPIDLGGNVREVRAYGVITGGGEEVLHGFGVESSSQPTVGDPTGIYCIALHQSADVDPRAFLMATPLGSNDVDDYVGMAEWHPDTPNCSNKTYEVQVYRYSPADDPDDVSRADDGFSFVIF